MAIIKLYSYETWLYKALNTALYSRDESKIATLGPYARMLDWALLSPPRENLLEIERLRSG